jgi:hypothetical protein
MEQDLVKCFSWLEIPNKGNSNTEVVLGFSEHYRASAGLEAMFLLFPNQSILRVTGLVTDSIVKVA